MYCLSVNYRSAPLALREKLQFSPDDQAMLMQELMQSPVSQCVLLCTCNRTEIYFCGIPEQIVRQKLSVYSGLSAAELLPHFRSYPEKNAIRHLFRVACGLHSMVLGEDEILRQVRQAYQFACDQGCVQYELHRCFQAAVTCAKRIKTETPLSVTPVSIATLAANEAVRCGENILVIGATGQIGTATVKNLLAHKNVRVTVTRRTHGGAFNIADARLHSADYAERYQLIADADCVISATASPHFTVTMQGLRQITLSKELLFIDLAVPPDIDPAAAELPQIRRMDIDSFAQLAQENLTVRADSKEAAEQLIDEELEQLRKTLIFHTFQPYFSDICGKLQAKPDQMLYRLRDGLDAQAFRQLMQILEDA